MSEQINQLADQAANDIATVLGTSDPAQQVETVRNLIRFANQPDVVIAIHFKPATGQFFFSSTARSIKPDALIEFLGDAMKAASLMKANQEIKKASEQASPQAP